LLFALAAAAVLLVLLGLLGFLVGNSLRPFQDGGFDIAGTGRATSGLEVESPDSPTPAGPDSGRDTSSTKATAADRAPPAVSSPVKGVRSREEAMRVAADGPQGMSASAAAPKKRKSPFVIPPSDKPKRPAAKGGGASAPVVAAKSGFRSMLAGRSDARRGQLLKAGGGTRESENAVDLGLKWLMNHQHGTGNWSLDRFHDVVACRGRCVDVGCGCRSDTAATSLALLPFLGRGYTHRGKKYNQLVESGLRWIVADQNSDGSFASIGNGKMYAHGQATIVLCEALAMTRDTKLLLEPATRAVVYIVNAQATGGGWRYNPGVAGDTSVQGWQIMALGSAVNAGIPVAESVFEQSQRFLDTTCIDRRGGMYTYTPGDGWATTTMTAEALLCRQYCGWPRNHAGLKLGTAFLVKHLPPDEPVNMYYWYYATQVLHHQGGKEWKTWNPAIRDLLIRSQETSGHKAGSWAPLGTGHDRRGGRVYMTALALCTLEVYYRHMPIFPTPPVRKR
jgi:hypothetical protein